MIQPTNVQMPMQAQYPQQGGANAVAINIYNPQAYGSAPNAQAGAVPQYCGQSVYGMPYVPTYSETGMTNPMAYQQYMPVNNTSQIIPYYPAQTAPAVEQSITQTSPQIIPYYPAQATSVAQEDMPQSIIAPQVAIQPPVAEQPQAAEQPQTVEQPQAVEQPQQPAKTVDVDALVQNLKSTDANVRGQAIKEIAGYAQEAPEVALQVVSEPIMQALVDIINEDTSKLEGPTAEQQAVNEKIQKGEKLTAEEQKIAEQQSSPQEIANHNKTIAIYTLAMIQKLQREELNQYIESQKANGQEAIAPLGVQDLIGYNEMANIAQNSKDDNLKLAAIEALGHVVEPQDKAVIEPILAPLKNSSNEDVKNAANEVVTKLAA